MTARGRVRCVLGIDAAWTPRQPSGVAVVVGAPGRWRCAGVAPSYASFEALAHGGAVPWGAPRHRGEAPDAGALLAAAERLSGWPVDLVAVDLPLARGPVRGRRASDRALTRAFVSRGCGVHSPLPQRPGRLADRLRAELEARGYRLATADRNPRSGRSVIEVYPHPALLELLGAPYRVPYKVGRSARYWPATPPADRVRLLLREWRRIRRALQGELGPLPLRLPRPSAVGSLASLKGTEDALDALISAWVGTRALEGRAQPYGDGRSAIWVPR